MFAPRFCTCLVMLVIGLCCLPTISYACTPSAPDPWFIERITVPPANLPNGVSIRAITMTPYNVARDYVEITNSASTPLYIIGTYWTGENTFAPLEMNFPAGTGPTHKVLNGQAFTWRSNFDSTPSTAHMDWQKGTYDRPDAVLLSIDDNTLKSDQGKVLDLAPSNRTGDHRLENVPLPAPQTLHVPLVYGTQLFHVPITVSYILNPAYEADGVAKRTQLCGRNDWIVPILCVVGPVIGGCIVASAFYWLGLRTGRNAA